MPSSTSEIETALHDHYRALDKEKVTFDVLDSCGRITDACFENAYVCRKKISLRIVLTSAVPVSICCRQISKQETGWLSVFHHFQIDWFVHEELSKFIHEKCGQGSLEVFKFWSSRQLD